MGLVGLFGPVGGRGEGVVDEGEVAIVPEPGELRMVEVLLVIE